MSDAGLDTEFKRGLGLFDATMVVVGSMIGSGIFIVSADMAQRIGSPGWLLVAWLVDRRLDRSGRVVLRRTGRADAVRRRPIRLSPRSVFAVVRLPLRLDALPCNPNRHHRRGRRGFRQVRRRPLAVTRRK